MGKVFFEDPIHHISGKISKNKQQIYKMVATVATAIVTCVAIALGLSSCNVTRTITTRSEAWQKGDTSVIIQTKTIETYDASKKGL